MLRHPWKLQQMMAKKEMNFNLLKVHFKWPDSLNRVTGWPDWTIFHQLGYFLRLIMIFCKDEVAKNNGDFLGFFLYKQIYYIFT